MCITAAVSLSNPCIWCLHDCKPLEFFFFNDTATTEIYTLSLHDALPIYLRDPHRRGGRRPCLLHRRAVGCVLPADRKSTRLNSSHGYISYAVFCLKKKKIESMKV